MGSDNEHRTFDCLRLTRVGADEFCATQDLKLGVHVTGVSWRNNIHGSWRSRAFTLIHHSVTSHREPRSNEQRILRQAILWHRYLGLGYCLLFAAWFLSGIVLLYVRIPELKEADRLAHLPRLDMSALRLTPERAFARTGLTRNPVRITLGMIGKRPVYRFLTGSGRWVTVFGDAGSPLERLDPASAVVIAETFDQQRSSKMRWINEISAVACWSGGLRIRCFDLLCFFTT